MSAFTRSALTATTGQRPVGRWLKGGLALIAMASVLSACAPLVIGGAMVGGAMVGTDRRTSGSQLEDQGIELRTSNRLHDALGDRGHLNVTSYNRQVLLTGEVPSEADKQTAEQVARQVENVRSLVNELAVMGNSSLSQRSSDALVTGKVKAGLVDARDLSANAFKVVTERGTVYLMGLVTQAEATRATDITRSVDGVQRVVRIFEIMTDEQLRATGVMQPAPATGGAAKP